MDTPTGIHFDTDGSVRFVTDSQAIRLRRPTLAEFSDIGDRADAADVDIMRANTPLQEIRRAILKGEVTDEQVDEFHNLNRKMRNAKADVVRYVIDVLGDVDDVGELPPWAVGGAPEVVAKLIKHWETVPFHGSGQNGT